MSEPGKGVFLSYSSQDADAARRICDALRSAGIEVWLDQSALRGGDAWDASIRTQIKECALFVPIVSASTNSRSEGYFRLEWRLAVERSLLMADDQAFLLPVLIDGTTEASARVPDRFRERQWMRLDGDAAMATFVGNVARLLGGGPAAADANAQSRAPSTGGRRDRRRRLLAGAALSATLLVAIISFTKWSGRSASPTPATPGTTTSASVADRNSIAVMPFDNLSGRAEDAYLADGLQEEILNALARVRTFNVISRTSVMEFRGNTRNVRDISRRLNVGSILEGSIRRDGRTLRLTVQLIDARDDHHVLAVNYDRDLAHILDLQSAVARQVADALRATLTQIERRELDRVATNNGDAYDRYLRAVAAFKVPVPDDESGLVEPRRLLEEAVHLDPGFSDALALLSQADTWAYQDSQLSDIGARAGKSLERALAADPQLPEVRLARGLYSLYVLGNLDQALADLDAVVRVRPNSSRAHAALGFALRRKGHIDMALRHFQRAWDLDPLNETYPDMVTTTLLGLRRFPEFAASARLYAERFPRAVDAYFNMAFLDSMMQHSAAPLRDLLRNHGGALDPVPRRFLLAMIARIEKRYLDAIRLWEMQPANDPPGRALLIGLLYRAAGDSRQAAQHLLTARHGAQALLDRAPTQTGALETLAVAQSVLGEHAAALASIDRARAISPEAHDAINGPRESFIRSIILMRAGRTSEGEAEVNRLLRVPFGGRIGLVDEFDPMMLLVEDDPRYDELINHPPRL
jgi:TolB-like protein/Flp pilus assembly protein TadD